MRISTHLMPSCLLVVLIGIASAARGENWPQWRGPHGNGTSTEESLPTRWSATQNVLWRAPMPGQGGATPVIWGERLFVTSSDGDDLLLICIDTANGKELWRRKVTDGNTDARGSEGNSASPSPSTDGEHVWVFFSTGILACYDYDGNETWKFDTGERFGKLDIQFGMTSTPFLDGDYLYLQLIHGPMVPRNDQRTGKVIKLDKLTGETVWEVDRVTEAVFECKHSYASPFMYDDGQRKFLIVHGADCTTGHSLDNGDELWRFGDLNGPTNINPQRHDPTFRFVASPVASQGTIIIPTCKGGPTIAINVNEALAGAAHEDAGVAQWTLPRTPDVSIPLIVEDLVYLLHKDGKLQCVELSSGKELYFERTDGSVELRSSPVYADGKIFFCNKQGMCTVVKAGPEFEILASNPMNGESITASPAISDGNLYIRSYDAVYAIRN